MRVGSARESGVRTLRLGGGGHRTSNNGLARQLVAVDFGQGSPLYCFLFLILAVFPL